MLFLFNAPFETYVRSNIGQTAGLTAVIMSAALIGVALSAYAEAALLPTLQSLMEGLYWPTWIVAIFAPSQINRYERLNREIAESLRLRGAFGTAAGGQTRAQAWQASLRTAREVGNGVATNNYTNRAESAKQVGKLARRRRHARAISGTAINSAVAGLTLDLRVNNADLLGPDGDFALETTRQLLCDLIVYADQYGPARYRFLITKRQFAFGPHPLAPTRLGNIGKTVQGYAVDRYNLNSSCSGRGSRRLHRKTRISNHYCGPRRHISIS
jgi:hypothetical protein